MNIYNDTKKIILDIIFNKFKNLDKNIESRVTCEKPKNDKFGDISTNVIMIINKILPEEKSVLAETITEEILKNKIFEKVNFVNPGFLNIVFKNSFWIYFLRNIYNKRNNYGFINLGKKKFINIEFVSANPTGPLHIGHLRGAIFGDVLARLLTKTGFNVTKEYYVNDLGVQVENLALTINHHIDNILNSKKKPLLENMYKGDYLKKIAVDFLKTKPFNPKNFEKLKEYSVACNLDLINSDLKSIGINFDHYVSEKSIHEKGLLSKIMKILKDSNVLYEGVLEKPVGKNEIDWRPSKQILFRSSKYGDKSDRVVIKNNGDYTYFASDIAYHYDKACRKYDEIINIWGADHAGYVDRVKASLLALGFKNTTFTVKLCQIVNLIDKKKVIKMSKRQGNFVLVSEIVPKIGQDALRIFMLTRKNDAHLDFDLEKCLRENNENPSFYIQYAYARISSLKKIANKKSMNLDEKNIKYKDKLLSSPEINIIRHLSLWPKVIEASVNFREPHRVVYYLIELASIFHSYWSLGKSEKKYKILSEENINLTQFRLLLIEMIQSVIRNGLNVLAVSARDEM